MRTQTSRPHHHRRLTAVGTATLLALTAVPAAAAGTPEHDSDSIESLLFTETGSATGTHLISDRRTRSTAPLGSINLTKQVRGEAPDVFREGDTVPYEFLVTNTDGEALTDVQVHDPLIGTDPVCTMASLAPAGYVDSSASCEGELVVTAADVAAGQLRNVATVTAQSVDGPVQDIDEVTVPVVGTGAVALYMTTTVTDGGDGQADAGDTLTFTFQVANTGNTELTEVGVTDTLVGPVTCSPEAIGPDQTATCAADHVITEHDVEAGQIIGTATVLATVPAGADPVVPIQHTHVTTIRASTLNLVLTGTATIDGSPEGSLAGAGDRLLYTFTLANTGGGPLTTPHVVGLSDEAIGCEADVLNPGDSTTCVAADPHVVTEADVMAGAVTVAARGVATTSLGLTVTGPEQTLRTVTRPAQAGLDLVVEVTRMTRTEAPLDVGDQLLTAALVTNTGTVSLTGLVVEAALGSPMRCEADFLVPGSSTTCVAVERYMVTVEDVLAGELVVTKTATALAPTGVAAMVPVTTSLTVPIGPDNAEELTPEPGDPGDPGHPGSPGGPGGPGAPGDDSGQGGGPAVDGPGGSAGAGTGSDPSGVSAVPDAPSSSGRSGGSGGVLAATGSPTIPLLALALLMIGIGVATQRTRKHHPER